MTTPTVADYSTEELLAEMRRQIEAHWKIRLYDEQATPENIIDLCKALIEDQATTTGYMFRRISDDVTETVPFEVKIHLERDGGNVAKWVNIDGGDLMVPAGARELGAALIAAADAAERFANF